MMKQYVLFTAALMIAGCVSMGTNYDPAAVGRLQKGMTQAEVIQMLGKPNTISTLPDGRVQLGWVHSTGSMFGANARGVSLLFDTNGRLIQTIGQNQFQMK
jgi:hypothetical protein